MIKKLDHFLLQTILLIHIQREVLIYDFSDLKPLEVAQTKFHKLIMPKAR